MTKEEEIRNSMREQREDAYNDGRAVGREEGRNRTIRQLLESGMSIDLIAKALNLTEEERLMLQ